MSKENSEITSNSESTVQRWVRWCLFKKKKIKKAEPDWRIKALEECKAFRALGETFNYMGVEMLVVNHGTLESHVYVDIWTTPHIQANYVNKQGEIKNIVFGYEEIEILRKQTQSNRHR